IELVSRPAELQILVCNTYEDAGKEIAEVEALRQRTDGMIVASALSPEQGQAYRKLIKDGMKLVLVDRLLENLRCPAVTTDNTMVGMIATEHLIGLGYRRIGHLRGASASVAKERFDGYKQALAKHKMRFDPSLVRECGFLEDQAYDAMRAWIAEGDLPE